MLSLPSSPLRPDPPVSSAPADFPGSPLIPRALAGRERPKLPARPSPLWLSVSLRLPSCPTPGDRSPASTQLTSASASAIAQFGTRLASPIPQSALSTLTGSWWVLPNDAISSPLATALEVARPPLSDRPRCSSASGRRSFYTRACPQQGHPRRESGMTTAPNWINAPAGPSPARTDSGRVERWRADGRVRWRFHDFRRGPQSGSPGHVSSALPKIPCVEFSPTRLKGQHVRPRLPTRTRG